MSVYELDPQAYALCAAIEKLPASREQTDLSIMASDLSLRVRKDREDIKFLNGQLEISEALQESAFRAGAKAGWNACCIPDPKEAQKKFESITKYDGHLGVIAKVKIERHAPKAAGGTKCAVCKCEIPDNWERLSSGALSVCMRCEGQKLLVFSLVEDTSVRFFTDFEKVCEAVIGMLGDNEVTITCEKMSVAKYLKLSGSKEG